MTRRAHAESTNKFTIWLRVIVNSPGLFALYFPTGQLRHFEESDALSVVLYFPPPQVIHEEAPDVALAYDPWTQSTQSELSSWEDSTVPALDIYFPSGQDLHEVEPSPSAYFPLRRACHVFVFGGIRKTTEIKRN